MNIRVNCGTTKETRFLCPLRGRSLFCGVRSLFWGAIAFGGRSLLRGRSLFCGGDRFF
ncbi:hypothetical protein [Planktothricoides raciborskii]|uniref:Uncharacterized protein n=1 Tax=Planktothricoides raciborskii FACHB-1370 TaxID=2949576 RepID=A0ABR8EAJ7_9CYAN|nr:hypothetical protein [Planktothricoides raciborskii]MBD2543738.1 hypothetical protein [Planktothricoides raciborskii FACHB-1370]MBD2582368.1 hypothetical protein [Planktothricoides raciborskii FACHB-1261]